MSLEVAIQSLADAIRLLANAHPAAAPTARPELTVEHDAPKSAFIDEDITEVVQKAVAEPVVEKPKRRTRKKAEDETETEAEPKVADAAPSLFDDLGLDDDEPEVEVTVEMLKQKLSELGQAKGKGREAVLAIFKELGAKTFSDIKPEQYSKAYRLASTDEA